MSESDTESSNDTGNDSSDVGISDDELPEDLVPGEDNPLAEGLDPDDMPEDLDLGEGKVADESEDGSDGSDGSDASSSSESGDAAEDTAD